MTRVNSDPASSHLSGRKAVMSRALLVLGLALSLGGPPLQWASSLVEVLLSATSDHGGVFDPNGSQPTSDYGGHFDPNG